MDLPDSGATVLVLGIAVTILVVSHIFGQRQWFGNHNSPYECGMLAQGSGSARFAVKFYVTAMLFILFDIEVVFLIPWCWYFVNFWRRSCLFSYQFSFSFLFWFWD